MGVRVRKRKRDREGWIEGLREREREAVSELNGFLSEIHLFPILLFVFFS